MTSSPSPENLTHHLEELRNRLIFCVATLLITISASFFAAKPIIHWIESLSPIDIAFIQLSPGEVLMTSLKVAILTGIALAAPILMYHIFRFMVPGLTHTEKRLLAVTTVGGTVLFSIGCWFSAQWVVPMALSFLLDFGTDLATNHIQITHFIDFCIGLMMMMGLMFELPLVIWALVGLKLLKPHQLAEQWRMVAVGCFLASAILTPSQDPFTMMLVGGTIFGLYALSLLPYANQLKAAPQSPASKN